MKKILLLLTVIFFLSLQTCFAGEIVAEETTIEDIDNYFVEDSGESIQQLDGFVEYNTEPDIEQDAVLLDSTEVYKFINISKPKFVNSKSTVVKKPEFSPIQDKLDSVSRFSAQEYDISPVSTFYGRKHGKFSFGTKYDSYMYKARVNYSTGLFSKYEGKHFALSGGFSKNTNNNYDSYNDKFSIVPEWKLTKRLSLLDVMQTDVAQINKKNEIVLRYKPSFTRYADDIELELGAGQYYYQGDYTKSSVRFSTRFKL